VSYSVKVNTMKTPALIIASLLLMLPLTSSAADKKLTTEKQKFSYAVGVQMGNNLKSQGVSDIDADALAQAIADILAGKEYRVPVEDMKAALQAFQTKMLAKQKKASEAALAAGKKFRDNFKKQKGVTELKNGIMYKVEKSGKGSKPSAKSTVTVNYEGSLITGKVFDSSYKRGQPATFPLTGVIKGWQEIMPLMSKGDKWQVVIPSDLAYGAKGAGASIGPNETLIFVIELLEVKG